MFKAKIFLSHTNSDKPFVRHLASKLEGHDVKVWLDEAEINVGDSLIEKISEGIEDAEYLGVVISPSSIGAPWVKKELSIALTEEINNRKLKVLPILIEQCELPIFLKDKLYADFTGNIPWDKALSLLLRAMGIQPNIGESEKIQIELTIESLRKYLADRFPDKKVGDWNDTGILLSQLEYIDMKTVSDLDNLLLTAQHGLQLLEAIFTSRLIGGHSPSGTVRAAMWIVSSKAAMTCAGGKELFNKYNKYVK